MEAVQRTIPRDYIRKGWVADPAVPTPTPGWSDASLAPPDSALGRAWARERSTGDYAGQLGARRRAWAARREECRRLIATATPGDDMAAVASATAEVTVLDRAIDQAAAQAEGAAASQREAETARWRLWGRYLTLQRWLTGEVWADERDEVAALSPENVVAEFKRLGGH